ncbi:hypothetical protein [Brachybacterium nesterenkovii]|uniref:Uncharacterized protein n=1 Tax=Brachybacterium nesterenkovii TaxID=47847 RepID=A0A1X6WV24_9MICO|nr:hypothetical protein [Brachybacterium nesterenkovii]SLM89300.1 hypothetical protein-signal peptide prediction [Brachybacterium nesterenkovii]
MDQSTSTPGYAGFTPAGTGTDPAAAGSADPERDAVEKYQYLLRTASPDQIEKAHEEAFAAMSESERAEVLQALAQAGAAPADASASSLARSATRMEIMQPGSLTSALSGTGVGTGGALLGGLAIGVLGSAVVNALFDTGGKPGILRRLLGGGMGPMGMGGFGQGMGGLLGGMLGQGQMRGGQGFGGPGGGPGGGSFGGGGRGFGGGPGGGFGGPGGGGPGGF